MTRMEPIYTDFSFLVHKKSALIRPIPHRRTGSICISILNFATGFRNIKTRTVVHHNRMKITVVGAGAVGATCADNIARRQLAQEVVLLDIKEGLSEGKALDIFQTATLCGFDTKITGSTNDYAKTAGSDVVVITSGLPRKPGMTREDLIGTNAKIVKGVTDNILQHSPDAIIIIVSNPMDTMTYLSLKTSGLAKNKLIGMGGILDSARFKTYLSLALDCPPNDIHGAVIGGHGDTTMIPPDSFGYPQRGASEPVPGRRNASESSGRYHGWWCYPDEVNWHVGLVCTGCSRSRTGREHCSRSETHFPLLRGPRWRVWSVGYLPRRTRGNREKWLGSHYRLQIKRRGAGCFR